MAADLTVTNTLSCPLCGHPASGASDDALSSCSNCGNLFEGEAAVELGTAPTALVGPSGVSHAATREARLVVAASAFCGLIGAYFSPTAM